MSIIVTLTYPRYRQFAALQAYDLYSTLTALHHGAVEANPVVRGVSGNLAALLGVKAVTTFGVVYVAERLWGERPRTTEAEGETNTTRPTTQPGRRLTLSEVLLLN